MTDSQMPDYYETLQISPNADHDTIQRVFRLLAQRFHPDNQDTGNAARFRELHDAYLVLNDPEKRAQYDLHHQALRQERWKFAASGSPGDNDFDMEQQMRCIVLEILYTRRRTEPDNVSLSTYDLSQLTGQPREHLHFTLWFLTQKKWITQDDQSRLTITADGVDHLEHQQASTAKRRLQAVSTPARA
jgi:curved DNA-binding protein CbpA